MSRDAYKIQLDQPLDQEIPRLFRSQVTRAKRALKSADDLGVHTARKAIKRARAVLRLIRGGVTQAHYRELDEHLKAIGRRLAGVRDIAVAITLTEMLAVEGSVRLPITKALLEYLNIERESAWSDLRAEEGIETIRAELGEMRISRSEVMGASALTLHDGLSWTYARGRERLLYATEHPGGATLHAWRRQAKHHGYQIRLLTPAWPQVLRANARAIDALTEALGDDHDLSELIRLARTSDLDSKDLAALQRQVRKRRREFQNVIWPLGARIYAEDAGAVAGRMTAYLAAALSEQHGAPVHPLDGMALAAPPNRASLAVS